MNKVVRKECLLTCKKQNVNKMNAILSLIVLDTNLRNNPKTGLFLLLLLRWVCWGMLLFCFVSFTKILIILFKTATCNEIMWQNWFRIIYVYVKSQSQACFFSSFTDMSIFRKLKQKCFNIVMFFFLSFFVSLFIVSFFLSFFLFLFHQKKRLPQTGGCLIQVDITSKIWFVSILHGRWWLLKDDHSLGFRFNCTSIVRNLTEMFIITL